MRDGQSVINKLTKQWFDDANREANVSQKLDAESKVYFKKSANQLNGGLKTTRFDDKTYDILDSSATTNILLDSTDDDDDLEDEQLVIDKTNLVK